MAIRTKLLNGNNITRDTDFSKFIETVSEPWVIKGLTVTANSVAVGQARVPCERTNGETLYALIYNTAPVSISGNGEVYILVNQTYIDDGELANEDGTGIATIVVGTTPSKNALKLATITNGVVADDRHIIPKVWELETYIRSLQSRIGSVEQEIDFLMDESADSLKEAWIVWEKYGLADNIFKQRTPAYDDSTVDFLVGDVNAHKQIHIQRIWSWTASNKLYLKVKSIWAPTTWLIVEVRRGELVNVSDSEAYWYGSELVCSWNIPYDWITNSYQMFEVNMNWQFGWLKGEILDVVVYQTNNIVNASNYYSIACDGSQNSECFSLVAVNGTTRTRSNLCPYCIGEWFLDRMIAKVSSASSTSSVQYTLTTTYATTWTYQITETYTTPQSYSTLYITAQQTTTQKTSTSGSSPTGWVSGSGYIQVAIDWTTVLSLWISSSAGSGNKTVKISNVPSWAVITITQRNPWYWAESRPWTTWYYAYGTVGKVFLSPNQTTVVKPLIPVEVKSIWEQTYGISYGRLNDGSWYGEFDGEIHTTAITGEITLWGCLGFKIITDSNGEQYKIPVYWV